MKAYLGYGEFDGDSMESFACKGTSADFHGASMESQ